MSTYDFIIVGSGTSGGIWSYYLTRAGKKVLLLEAGKEYNAKTFPDDELTLNSELIWNGGMDVTTDASMAFLRGKCLGGGSIINQCLLDRFDSLAFEDWKAKSGIDFFTLNEFNNYYDEVESHLSLQYIPKEQWNRNAELYVEGFEKLGFKWAPLRRGHTDCAIDKGNDCIVCLGGCPRNSKQSMLITYIKEARDQGLEIQTEFMAEKLVYNEDSVTIKGKTAKNEIKEFTGKKCVIAAGALGTTQLLYRSDFKKKLPALGEGFFCHPQIMNFAFMDEPVDAHKGMFQSVKSDDPRMREKGFKLENVFAGPIDVAMLNTAYGKEHQNWMKKYRYMMCMEVAVRDVGAGKISVDKKGRLKIKKKMSKEDKKRAEEGIKTVNQIFKAVGAKEIYNSPLRFGLHLMGGCAIGKDPKKSVVNEKFQVHGYPNILISDSSTFPSAPGINPALTIMALSYKASQITLNEF